MILREAKKLRKMMRPTESSRWRRAKYLRLNELEDNHSAV